MCARTAPLSDSFCHKSCNTWEEVCSPEVPHEVPLHSSLASQPLIGPAWPNSAQGTARWRQRESQLQQQKWCKRLPLPAHTHFPLPEISYPAGPEISMESLQYTGPQFSSALIIKWESTILTAVTKPAQSVNRFSKAGVRIEKKETIRQYCSMTQVNSET